MSCLAIVSGSTAAGRHCSDRRLCPRSQVPMTNTELAEQICRKSLSKPTGLDEMLYDGKLFDLDRWKLNRRFVETHAALPRPKARERGANVICTQSTLSPSAVRR